MQPSCTNASNCYLILVDLSLLSLDRSSSRRVNLLLVQDSTKVKVIWQKAISLGSCRYLLSCHVTSCHVTAAVLVWSNGNSAIRLADLENPNVEPYMRWIEWLDAEISPFEMWHTWGVHLWPTFWGRGGRKGSPIVPIKRAMVVSY